MSARREAFSRIRCERTNGRSALTELYSESPLRLLATHNSEAHWIYQSSYGGGLVDGDHLSLGINVQPNASLLLTTQGSTKIYKGHASQKIDAHVAENAWLVAWPDPLVAFADAHYEQTATVHLHKDASLVWVDWYTSGRKASGEHWAFSHYASRFVLHVEGKPLVNDCQRLARDSHARKNDLAERAQRFDVFGLVWLYGEEPAVAASRWSLAAAPRSPVYTCANPVNERLWVLRFAATDVEQARNLLQRLLSFTHTPLGDDPWRRKH